MTSAQDLLQSYLSSPEALCEAAARLLFMNVRWMKSIPAFLSLPYTDQLTLLDEGWRELFVLGACQFQMPMDSAPLLNHAGKYNHTCKSEVLGCRGRRRVGLLCYPVLVRDNVGHFIVSIGGRLDGPSGR